MGEESTLVRAHIPCENCGSSDANSEYSDGHQFCYSCSTHVKGESAIKAPDKKSEYNFVKGEVSALRARKITEDTCRKFGYSIAKYNGEKVQVATYRKNGQIVGQKIRTKDKQFRWIGSNEPGLYGQHLWKSGGKKIIITEGEIDCLSVSQCQDNRWPCVSLPHGAAAAKKAIKQELEYLESFEEVILLFDMDDPGQKAAHECLSLLSPGKAKIASLPMKDANEMLLAGKGGEIITAIWNAKEYLPSGIRKASEMWEELNTPIKEGLSYPWPTLTRLTYGIRRGELIMIGSGTGMGKSTCMKQIAHWLLKEHKEKVGLLFLEESNKVTINSLLSLEMRQPLHLPNIEVDNEKKKKKFDELFRDDKLYLFDHFGSTQWDDIKLRIRFLVVSCGVKYIFLDHITALTSGGQQTDERKEVDRVMTELASLVHELDICMFAISHLSTPEKGSFEEGSRVQIKHFRGSRSIGQWSSFVMALERDQQAEDADERHTSTFRILKDRFSGESTGATFKLKFNNQTQQLTELEDNSVFDEPVQESTNDFSDF